MFHCVWDSFFVQFKFVFLQIIMYIFPNYIHISVLDMFHCGWAVCMTTADKTCCFSPQSCPARQIPNLIHTNPKQNIKQIFLTNGKNLPSLVFQIQTNLKPNSNKSSTLSKLATLTYSNKTSAIFENSKLKKKHSCSILFQYKVQNKPLQSCFEIISKRSKFMTKSFKSESCLCQWYNEGSVLEILFRLKTRVEFQNTKTHFWSRIEGGEEFSAGGKLVPFQALAKRGRVHQTQIQDFPRRHLELTSKCRKYKYKYSIQAHQQIHKQKIYWYSLLDINMWRGVSIIHSEAL